MEINILIINILKCLFLSENSIYNILIDREKSKYYFIAMLNFRLKVHSLGLILIIQRKNKI